VQRRVEGAQCVHRSLADGRLGTAVPPERVLQHRPVLRGERCARPVHAVEIDMARRLRAVRRTADQFGDEHAILRRRYLERGAECGRRDGRVRQCAFERPGRADPDQSAPAFLALDMQDDAAFGLVAQHGEPAPSPKPSAFSALPWRAGSSSRHPPPKRDSSSIARSMTRPSSMRPGLAPSGRKGERSKGWSDQTCQRPASTPFVLNWRPSRVT
jgi:hypothetical protein